MTKSEIHKALESLTPAERQEIRDRIDALNDEEADWDDISPAQREMILVRIAEMDRNPGQCIPWEEVRAEMRARRPKRDR